MVKLDKVYFANRSTPQIVKHGKTAKSKQGYGKQTSRKPLSDAEMQKARRGEWIRTREDGKSPPDPTAKKSKYRPKQAAKQRAGDKRRAAAKKAGKAAAVKKTVTKQRAKKPAVKRGRRKTKS